MDSEKFREDQKLDPNGLDLAAVIQGELFFFWAEQLAEARRQTDRAKLMVEMVEAGLAMRIRKSPEDFGLSKTTDSCVKNAVRIHAEYIEASEGLIEMKYEQQLLEAAATAMEQRKRMIEVMVTLHGQSYFSVPKSPKKDLAGEWKEFQTAQTIRVEDAQRASARKRSKRSEKEIKT